MAAFNGQLRSNEIFSALYNMIISQQVFADNIQKHQTLVDKAKEEAGLYGDQKLYYSADVLHVDSLPTEPPGTPNPSGSGSRSVVSDSLQPHGR